MAVDGTKGHRVEELVDVIHEAKEKERAVLNLHLVVVFLWARRDARAILVGASKTPSAVNLALGKIVPLEKPLIESREGDSLNGIGEKGAAVDVILVHRSDLVNFLVREDYIVPNPIICRSHLIRYK